MPWHLIIIVYKRIEKYSSACGRVHIPLHSFESSHLVIQGGGHLFPVAWEMLTKVHCNMQVCLGICSWSHRDLQYFTICWLFTQSTRCGSVRNTKGTSYQITPLDALHYLSQGLLISFVTWEDFAIEHLPTRNLWGYTPVYKYVQIYNSLQCHASAHAGQCWSILGLSTLSLLPYCYWTH